MDGWCTWSNTKAEKALASKKRGRRSSQRENCRYVQYGGIHLMIYTALEKCPIALADLAGTIVRRLKGGRCFLGCGMVRWHAMTMRHTRH